ERSGLSHTINWFDMQMRGLHDAFRVSAGARLPACGQGRPRVHIANGYSGAPDVIPEGHGVRSDDPHDDWRGNRHGDIRGSGHSRCKNDCDVKNQEDGVVTALPHYVLRLVLKWLGVSWWRKHFVGVAERASGRWPAAQD